MVFPLELGVTTETVSVTGEAPLLNAVNAEQDISCWRGSFRHGISHQEASYDHD